MHVHGTLNGSIFPGGRLTGLLAFMPASHRKLYADEKSKLGSKPNNPQPKVLPESPSPNPKPRQAGVPMSASPLGPLKKEVRRGGACTHARQACFALGNAAAASRVPNAPLRASLRHETGGPLHCPIL